MTAAPVVNSQREEKGDSMGVEITCIKNHCAGLVGECRCQA